MFGKTTTILFWTCTLLCFWAFHRGLCRRAGDLRPVRWAEGALDRWRPWLTAAALAMAFAIGLYVRLYRFPELPGGANQDGAMAATDAMALIQYGTDRLGTPWPAHLEAWTYGQMSSLLTYLMAGVFKLFGVSRLTFRLPQMAVSLLSIPVFWDFARRTLGKNFGWLALALLLINPWHIMQSRWTIDCDLFPHFFLFGAYCLLRGYERRLWYYAAMVCFALSMYTYGIALYTVPPFLLAAVIVLLCLKRVRWHDALGCAALYLLVAAPFLAVMILNFVGGETFKLFGLTIQFFESSIRSEDIVFFRQPMYAALVGNAANMLRVLLYQLDWHHIWNLMDYGSNYLFAMPLIIAGIAGFIGDRMSKRQPWLAMPEASDPQTESRLRARWGMLLAILWLLAAIGSALITAKANLGRSAILMYPVILMIAYAVYLISQRRRLLAVALAAIFALGAVRFAGDYFSYNTQHLLGRYYYYGLVEAMEATRERPMDTLYIVQTWPYENQYGIPEKVLLEYAARLDSKYVREGKAIADPDGRAWLPFEERYQLVKRADLQIDPQAEALYIIYEPDKEAFEAFGPGAFTFEQFGFDYYLVTPRALSVES